jgi:hypothetical protein
MRSLIPLVRSGFFLVTSVLLAAPAIAQSGPVFLGTDPVVVGKSPLPMANISSLGVDADGNQYYADAVAGRVIEVTPSGTTTTIATGLNKPLIAVDFLGDVFIADTGTSRVLKVPALPARAPAVLASVSGQHAFTVDGAENAFLLSGDQLVETPVNGSLMVVSTIPGASMLGFGPGANGNGHLYIVSLQNGVYSAQLYTYSYSGGSGTLSGPLRDVLPNVVGAIPESFFVDPQGDTIVVDNASGHGKVIIGAANGYKHAFFTGGIPTVPVTQDDLGNLYYVNGPSLIQIQLGTVNFGALNVPDGFGFYPPEFTLNFGAPPNVTWVLSQEPAGSFIEGDIQSGSGPLVDQAQLYLYFWPPFYGVGYEGGSLNLTDQNNVTTLSVPLIGTATMGWEAYFLPAQNLKAHPSGLAAQALETVRSRCNCGSFALDRQAGRITRNGNELISGLQNVQGTDVDAQGNLYVVQSGVAGVLRVAANGSTSTIATDIADPGGSAMDGLGNLYVINGDDIVRVAPDGSEAVFATPQTNGGPTSLLSVAVDLFNNVYAGYGTRPDSALGAILKFTHGGAHQLVQTDAKQPTGLASYPCGPLYFADAERGTVAVVPASGLEKVIGFGLTDPTNLQCSPAGGVSGQDPGVAGGQFSVSPISFPFYYNFGKVAVGSSRSITLAAVSAGSDQSGGASGGGEVWPAGGPNFLPNQALSTGALTDIPLVFMPTAVGAYGPYAIEFYDEGDTDSFSGLETIYLSGTGVNLPSSQITPVQP